MEKNLLDKSNRIEIIDVLRGFSLLGIAMVHFTEQYYAGPTPEAMAKLTPHGIADQVVDVITGLFIRGKFFTIFSFLFGLSFFIQLDRSDKPNSFFFRFAWRLIVLMGIGFVHSLHYRGDILTIYAVLGFGLLLVYKLPDKALLFVALFLVFDFPAFLTRVVQTFMESPLTPEMNQKDLQFYFDTLKHGKYLAILRANIPEIVTKFQFQVEFGRAYITLGLFFLGFYAGRKNFFSTWENQIPWIKKMCKIAGWMALGSVLFAAVFFGGTQIAKIEVPQTLQFAVGGLTIDIFNCCIATLYVFGILLSFNKEKWKARWMNFYAVGRMGLTTYLTQTLFGFFIYFSAGFSLLNEIGAATALAIGLTVFLVQIFFSKWWLSRFQYGPVEWLWRSLTYFKIQPMLKSKRTTEGEIISA
ncbi:MAG TPA: DUF418 domain-containing protein [Cyclobacteriaceae bacterium]|jgi:uncharacterized protein|nr:DUF418 domain-containing protein [Cyclobacteriaceae bacterium]